MKLGNALTSWLLKGSQILLLHCFVLSETMPVRHYSVLMLLTVVGWEEKNMDRTKWKIHLFQTLQLREHSLVCGLLWFAAVHVPQLWGHLWWLSTDHITWLGQIDQTKHLQSSELQCILIVFFSRNLWYSHCIPLSRTQLWELWSKVMLDLCKTGIK